MIVMFLDDGFGCEGDFLSCSDVAVSIKNDLLESGFVPKAEKSLWVPVQIIEFLGNTLDSTINSIYIPDRRIQKALNTLSEIEYSLKKHRRFHVRKLASFVGQIISMSVVIGHISQIMTRYLSIDIAAVQSWASYIQLNCGSMTQLKFWKENLQVLNISKINVEDFFTKIVFSDASGTGFADYEVKTVNGVAQGQWTNDEQVRSSTWRELTAVFRVMQSIVHVLRGHKVKWFSDNQAVSSVVKKGSMNVELQTIAFSIFTYCLKNSIVLDVEWIPREENERADYLSKIVDKDDWGISFHIVRLIESKWGNLEVDWFASAHNSKLPVFYSQFWNERCSGVDAFSEFWSGKFGLFVPTIITVARVLRKMQSDKISGVLIVPSWSSANFWPLLCVGGRFISNVVDWIELPTNKENYTACINGAGIFGNEKLKFKMLALRLIF
ncbi:uncharacterized protein LOC128549601 [Mercenaria mercenaria]|uniref:uncharacterized protein LOC128549601 n=1 Tax=Mercenaria mercenaria TaxID=6596 RepID=UPI00234EFADE|nr:uncharacterized protein LOC128549601 [Mercenaria mercenaria]